jgi:hypothetical protein
MSMPPGGAPIDAAGLNYQGSEFLFRTDKGIETSRGFDALYNYPVLLKVSYAALKQIDVDFRENDDRQSIDINAVTLDGKAFPLFSLNSNLFGRLHSYMGMQDKEVTLEAGTFIYDPKDNSLNSSIKDQPLAISERTFSGLFAEKKERLDEKAVIKHFNAELLSGDVFANKTHQFTCEFFAEHAELLILSMDYEAASGWKLRIGQKIGPQTPKDAELKTQWMKTISPCVDTRYICPITKKMLVQPVWVKGSCVSYELDALKQWQLEGRGVPPNPKDIIDEMLERAQKLRQAIDNELAAQQEMQPGQLISNELLEQIERLEYWAERQEFVEKFADIAHFGKNERAEFILERIEKKLTGIKERTQYSVVPCPLEISPNLVVQQIINGFRLTHTVLE